MTDRNATMLLPALMLASAAGAQVAEMAPFQGELSEDLDGFPGEQVVAALDIFDGFMTVSSMDGDTTVHLLTNSTLFNDLVVPSSLPLMLGVLDQAIWDFDRPVLRLGALWENNSGEDDATLELFAVDGTLIEAVTVTVSVDAQTWQWNGWESSVPIRRAVLTGNGAVQGFVWYDDLQLDPVSLADVNVDGAVDVDDLVAVIQAWGDCPGPPSPCPADVNGDGAVSVEDLIEVVLNWS